MASRSIFCGIKLTPGKPHELHVPEGELLQIQQVALAAPAGKETCGILSIKTEHFPELVVCTLRATCAMTALELIVSPEDKAVITVRGAAVDVCAHYIPDDDDDEAMRTMTAMTKTTMRTTMYLS